MKTFKNILITVAAVAGAFGATSCGDSFLEEKLTTQMSTQYLETPEGMRDLALGMPQILRLTHSHEFSYTMTNYGTDEFQVGSDPSNTPWNNYSAVLRSSMTGPNLVSPEVAWDICYVAINTVNTVLDKAPNVLTDEAEINTMQGEAYFFRAWAYFFLVQQWGGVPLKLLPSESLEREFTRASRQEVLQQVIDDFREGYSRLDNPANRTQGKVYKDAAAHFLAKALLYRQSEICDEFNAATKDDDLAQALQLCNEVISHRTLAPNFADIWDFTGADGPNESLDEILLAAQHTASTSGANGRYLNNLCLMFVSIYQNWTGMERDIAGGREYARLKNTNYAYDVYDRVNDSRFWKSFRTKQRLNYPADRNGDDRELELSMGQLGVMFIINDEDDADRFQVTPKINAEGNPDTYLPGPTPGEQPPRVLMKNSAGQYETVKCPQTGNIVPNVLPRYRVVAGYPGISTFNYSSDGVWPTLNKYLDGTRPDYNSNNSARDGITARLAETYLMAAEILVRQGKYQEAISQYINPVRDRAAYKAGEDRAKYVDGAQTYTNTTDSRRSTSFYGENSYYESNNIPITTSATSITVSGPNDLPAEDQAIIRQLGYTSDFDKMLCFVLNERSRELMGEMYRWADLQRTRTLIKRAYAFNGGVSSDKTLDEHHYLRPVPQTFLDGIYRDGKPLSADEKQALQNPGY
ncbi:MAG: RagB/SusD family nutrient uptake outer membrane protein [Tannerella sp.]|jgi:tetratricopeptide (TPR) repeat protein|nr:RagB/SusD family nutrient uptake outer membrane protein [Tannerella sp.]